MRVTIWHNPKCSTSRKVLDRIRAEGTEPVILDYLRAPPSEAEIRAVLREAGLRARDLVRRRGNQLEALGLDHPQVSEVALVAAMHAHPALIERPVVRTPRGTRLCRPPELVEEIL
ncbi:MAG: arsenate reductase (glutaredoxin) [Proteobacteria bacterium]|nr:arsenate reductase (glutaredoxin) [Pseudomonadota bacterium]